MKSLIAAAATAAALAGALVVPSAAFAHGDRGWYGYRGGWDGYRGDYRPRGPGHYKHGPRYAYGPPPVVYYPAPPRVYYPAPVVVAPPPPVVAYPRAYPPVGHVSIGFGFQF